MPVFQYRAFALPCGVVVRTRAVTTEGSKSAAHTYSPSVTLLSEHEVSDGVVYPANSFVITGRKDLLELAAAIQVALEVVP